MGAVCPGQASLPFVLLFALGGNAARFFPRAAPKGTPLGSGSTRNPRAPSGCDDDRICPYHPSRPLWGR